MSNEVIESLSKETLFRNGKSFWFASMFLNKRSTRDAVILYAFCRLLDDWADSGGDAGPKKLNDLIDLFNRSAGEEDNLTDQVLSIKSFSQGEKELTVEFLKLRLSIPVLLQLLQGLQKDTERALVEEKSQLIVYAYRVAGTVGLFMAQILGAKSEKAKYHAVDLGIAMQLTNVCRDVLEDARMGRRYLPNGILPSTTEAADLKTREKIKDCIRETLTLADKYYESGVQGIHHLPKRSRFAVYMMSKIYRYIGVSILNNGISWWEGRAYVPTYKKILLTFSALPKALHYLLNRHSFEDKERKHNAKLHEFLHGLPGVNQ